MSMTTVTLTHDLFVSPWYLIVSLELPIYGSILKSSQCWTLVTSLCHLSNCDTNDIDTNHTPTGT